MSGGSYNYLCYKDSSNIREVKGDIKEMTERLIGLEYLDAAKETESLILFINSFEVKVQARIDRLKGVWRSVEWFDSADSSEEYVKEEIEKYRNK